MGLLLQIAGGGENLWLDFCLVYCCLLFHLLWCVIFDFWYSLKNVKHLGKKHEVYYLHLYFVMIHLHTNEAYLDFLAKHQTSSFCISVHELWAQECYWQLSTLVSVFLVYVFLHIGFCKEGQRGKSSELTLSFLTAIMLVKIIDYYEKMLTISEDVIEFLSSSLACLS